MGFTHLQPNLTTEVSTRSEVVNKSMKKKKQNWMNLNGVHVEG